VYQMGLLHGVQVGVMLRDRNGLDSPSVMDLWVPQKVGSILTS
jgi:hypothetical protein